VLVDSASNQYILSHPHDITVAIEDHRFIHDIINLLLLSFLLGIVCSLFKIPSLSGYIFAGMVLGPSGYNTIISVVQVETIGEFGVFFIVFAVGLEFSPDKLHKVGLSFTLPIHLVIINAAPPPPLSSAL
jgi:Kef-type K+ transport system membrane component KefB